MGNRACAILIVIEQRTSLLDLGHLCILCALIKLVSPKYLMSDHCLQSNGSDG